MMTLSVIILLRPSCIHPRQQNMRTIIDIPEAQVAALRELEKAKKVSRAELIRQAIAQFVTTQSPIESAFGAWKARKGRPVDGLALERKLRNEWKR